MPPKNGKRKNRGKRLNGKKQTMKPTMNQTINPDHISEDDKSYIFVVKNNTDNYRLDNPTATILFELPRKHYYDMKNNIRIYIKPTSLFLYNKESNIITGPFIGMSPVYYDSKVKFPSKINVIICEGYLRVKFKNFIIKEGLCSNEYINHIFYNNLPKLPQLDVESQHIAYNVFESLGI